jgi:hypothetical protein
MPKEQKQYAFRDSESAAHFKFLSTMVIPAPPEIHMSTSGAVEVIHGTYVHTWNPPCGQCTCVDISVLLPPTKEPNGAEIVSVSYFNRGRDGLWHPNPPDVDLEWAMMLKAGETPVVLPNNWYSLKVTSTFKNWSHNLNRAGRIDVYWKLAARSTKPKPRKK